MDASTSQYEIDETGALIRYRQAGLSDVAALAKLRAISWSTEEYWNERIRDYLNCKIRPRDALEARIIYVAESGAAVVALVAGHLTKRFGCEGELEWIDVIPEKRRNGIASELVRLLAAWFAGHSAFRICVDPGNEPARMFYRRLEAQDLNAHWMYWPDIRILVKKAESRSGLI